MIEWALQFDQLLELAIKVMKPFILMEPSQVLLIQLRLHLLSGQQLVHSTTTAADQQQLLKARSFHPKRAFSSFKYPSFYLRLSIFFSSCLSVFFHPLRASPKEHY